MRLRLGTSTLCMLLLSGSAFAAPEPTMDEALQGFDDPPAETTDGGGDPSLDAILDGFDDSVDTTNTAESAPEEKKSWELGGALTLGAAYNYAHDAPPDGETDYRGLSRLRGKLNLELDVQLPAGWRGHAAGYAFYDAAYQINGRNDYTDEVLDTYEEEAELGEAWLQGRLDRQTDLKLGRQIVVWGKSDNIRITDVINPLDNREPGMVDIEDLRLPLGMARLDHYIGDWGLTAMAIPEIRFNKNPAYGSDFYPYATPMPHEEIPSDGGENTEYALAANGIFSGWDMSLYWAQVFDDTPHLVATASGTELRHARLTMAGFAANIAIDNWLLKTEAAHLSDLEYASLPGEKLERIDSLLGVEYSGFRDTTLTLEVANRHLRDDDSRLLGEGVEQDEWQTAFRYQGDFMHARLHLLALISAYGEGLDQGGFGRYSAAYDIIDALTLTGGVVNYMSGDKRPFDAISDNDRLFVDLKYSF